MVHFPERKSCFFYSFGFFSQERYGDHWFIIKTGRWAKPSGPASKEDQRTPGIHTMFLISSYFTFSFVYCFILPFSESMYHSDMNNEALHRVEFSFFSIKLSSDSGLICFPAAVQKYICHLIFSFRTPNLPFGYVCHHFFRVFTFYISFGHTVANYFPDSSFHSCCRLHHYVVTLNIFNS